MSPTQRLLAFAAGAHDIPADVREAAETLIVDTLCVGVAGATAPGAGAVFEAARRWGAGSAWPIGTMPGPRLSPASAAFVNGFHIHCLEWDAVHEPAVVHAMSVVTAAVMAASQGRGGVPVDRALDAAIVGVEVACALGVAASSPLRFFRPATAGLIGAAFACARVMEVPRDRFDDVLGLAYSQCAGTMQAHVEGSIALPLQIGHAARAAVTAVDLVLQGLTGPHDALEGPFGYFTLFDEGALRPVAETLGSTWRVGEISVKPWPSGRASHASLSVLNGQSAESVIAVEARVPPLVARLVDRPWLDEMTPAYARLCLPFLAALMLTDARIDPRRFIPQVFGDPVLRAIGGRLTIADDGNPDPNALSPQRFRLTLASGGVLEQDVAATPGSPANPLYPAALGEKAAFALSLNPEVTVPPSLHILAGHA